MNAIGTTKDFETELVMRFVQPGASDGVPIAIVVDSDKPPWHIETLPDGWIHMQGSVTVQLPIEREGQYRLLVAQRPPAILAELPLEVRLSPGARA